MDIGHSRLILHRQSDVLRMNTASTTGDHYCTWGQRMPLGDMCALEPFQP
jgi:hypothetical protein